MRKSIDGTSLPKREIEDGLCGVENLDHWTSSGDQRGGEVELTKKF